jgi:FkbM family methyltransferase
VQRIHNFIKHHVLEKAILKTAKLANLDLLSLAHKNMGIMKYQNSMISGESFVISKILKKLITAEAPVLFDVGANSGDYSRLLRREFPGAGIFAFEPNMVSFERLIDNLSAEKIRCFNLALGSTKTTTKIYNYADDRKSGKHASLYDEVLVDLHKAEQIAESECEMTTIDNFCRAHQIQYVDFLKLDTEGNELDVLSGAGQFIAADKIGIIQFEFNEMNVISRAFLKDFYDILHAYKIYRIDTNELIPLLCYETRNEIFQFQNLLAVNGKIPFPDNLGQ